MIDSLFSALQGHIAHLAAHTNGNHVILRCLQSIPESFCTPLYEELVQHCIEVPLFLASPNLSRSPRIATAAA